VKEYHSPSHVNVKDDSGDLVSREIRAHLVETVAYRTADWHAYRPTKLYGLDIDPDLFAILDRLKSLEPISNRFTTGGGPIENGFDSFQSRCHSWTRRVHMYSTI